MTPRARSRVEHRVGDADRVARGSWGDEPIRDIRMLPSAAALERRLTTTRPHPPESVGEKMPERFEPDPQFATWLQGTFVDATGPLANDEHEHLAQARIGVLWTNAINVRQMRHILGTAEMPGVGAQGPRWKRARAEQQLRDWFGEEVDFLLTFYAPEVDALDNRAFCALVEHELLHCAQARDQYGGLVFSKSTGLPVFAIRGHDVEEFVGVVERYGATTPEVRQLARAATRVPLIGDGPINIACGTCATRAA